MNKFHTQIDKKKGSPQEEWQEALCKLVLEEWKKGSQHVSELNRLYEDIYDMIRGERPEKNYDWQSNIVINKVFQVIWTAIPYISQKIFGATPIIGVKSYNKKGSWQREQILEFWHTLQTTTDKEHITYYLVFIMWLLRALLNGVSYMKKGWHQKLQRKTVSIDIPMIIGANGEALQSEKYEKTFTLPIEDWPLNRVVNNKDIVVDWLLQPGQSCRQGRFIIERNLLDLDALYSSKVNYMNLDEIDSQSSANTGTLIQDHASSRGKDGLETPPESDIYSEVEAYERVGKIPVYKERKEGQWIPCFDKEDIYTDKVIMKEMIVTVAKCSQTNILIRFDNNPYGQKNYIDMHVFFDEERWQSMGMVEPIQDSCTALNDNINAVFDKIWQELMPPVIVNKFALWDWDTMQYAPQQRWLVGGNPKDAAYFKEPSRVTSDAWQNHALFDSEINLTSSITPSLQGVGAEKTATTNVMNAQFSAARLDHIIKMVEQTALIPSAQMDVEFAKRFAHPNTFKAILGEPFEYGRWEEIYKYIPAASSVKLEHQKQIEIQEDIQLIQILSTLQNPNMPKIVNVLWKNILRNRNMPQEAAMLDEDFYEPSSDAGNAQMMGRMLGPRAKSNQTGIPMSGEERGVRQLTYEGRR